MSAKSDMSTGRMKSLGAGSGSFAGARPCVVHADMSVATDAVCGVCCVLCALCSVLCVAGIDVDERVSRDPSPVWHKTWRWGMRAGHYSCESGLKIPTVP